MVYIMMLYRRVPLRRSIIVSAVGLPAIVAVQYFDGSMPIWFWIVGMLLAFGCMYLTILFGAGTGKREGLYITARAFVLAELVASLHWQIVAFIGTHDAQATSYGVQAIVMLIVIYALCFGLAWLVERGNFSQTTPTLPTASAATATVAITIVTFAMSNPQARFDQYAILRGSMGQEIFYIRTLVDFCGFAILYAQQEQARRIEASAKSRQSTRSWKASIRSTCSRRRTSNRLVGLRTIDIQIAALRAEVDPEHAAASSSSWRSRCSATAPSSIPAIPCSTSSSPQKSALAPIVASVSLPWRTARCWTVCRRWLSHRYSATRSTMRLKRDVETAESGTATYQTWLCSNKITLL